MLNKYQVEIKLLNDVEYKADFATEAEAMAWVKGSNVNNLLSEWKMSAVTFLSQSEKKVQVC
jgi:hypothetical protein